MNISPREFNSCKRSLLFSAAMINRAVSASRRKIDAEATEGSVIRQLRGQLLLLGIVIKLELSRAENNDKKGRKRHDTFG